jgi:RNA polymerase sigma-70 factor (ECF subfamily)
MGDSDLEFQKIYAAYQPKIRRYLAYLVGEDEAEDLTQEVFVKVNRAIKTFRGESRLSTWLYRIATNTGIDRIRSSPFKRITHEGLLTVSLEKGEAEFDVKNVWTGEKLPSSEQELVRKQMNECIKDFIEKLPENYRTVLVLSELQVISNREIAEILGVTVGTVKIRLHRAREKLKEELLAHCDSYWIEENEFVPDLNHIFEEFRNKDQGVSFPD